MKINDETQDINQNPVAFQEDAPAKELSYWEWFIKNVPANKLYSEQLQPVLLQYPKQAASDKRQAYDSGINSVVQSQVVNQPILQMPPYQPSGIATTDKTYQKSLELAGRDTRLVAVLVDFIILLLPIFFAVWIAFFFFADVFNVSDEAGEILASYTEILTDQFEMVIALLGFVLLSLLIIVLLNLGWLCQNGQTIGKRLLSIKIVRTDGSKVGLLRIICLRGLAVPFLALVSTLPWWKSIIFFVNHLLIFQESRRCGHDLIADTTVIEAIEGGSIHRSTAQTIIAAIILFILSLIMMGGIVTMAKDFTIPDFDHTYYFSSIYAETGLQPVPEHFALETRTAKTKTIKMDGVANPSPASKSLIPDRFLKPVRSVETRLCHLHLSCRLRMFALCRSQDFIDCIEVSFG